MKTSMRNLLLNLAAIGLLALFLVWAETNLDGYKVQILNLIAVNAILALSLNLIYGFTGMFSLGHAGFMAIGAYVSALCVLPAAQKEMMWILEDIIWPFSVIHTPFWFSVVAGGFVAAIFGLFIAIPVLRLGGDYLGIATLGFAEIIRVLIVNLTPITNGSLGIKGIPFHASLLVNYGWLLITLYCMVKLLGSNFGNIFKAIRDDEIAAKVMGIDTFRTKVLSFCLGAFFAGVGGALLGNLLTTIDPKMFTFLLTFNVLMFVVAGGLGSLTGSILFPIKKDEEQVLRVKKDSANRNKLLAAARQGDEDAIETLTLEDMDMYTTISRRIQKDDIFSLVDTYFMPYGVECDQYSVLGEIMELRLATNDITGEKVYILTILCNELSFDVCINEKDLYGEPQVGRRFKGVIWLQGYINFPEE